MRAPYKICLVPYLDNPDKLHPSWYHYDIIGGGIEYIRKDALLEWLDKELDRLCELPPDASNLGQYMQTKKLFDKLNSL